MKIKVETPKSKSGDFPNYKITFSEMTAGKVMALHEALRRYSAESAVAADVFRPLDENDIVKAILG